MKALMIWFAEPWIGKDVEGSSRDPIYVSILAYVDSATNTTNNSQSGRSVSKPRFE
jgi:hypothetical protein